MVTGNPMSRRFIVSLSRTLVFKAELKSTSSILAECCCFQVGDSVVNRYDNDILSCPVSSVCNLKCVECEWKASEQFLKKNFSGSNVRISFSEIHSTICAHTNLGCQWTRQIFFSSFFSQAKVVVTLIRNKFLFQQDRVIEDNESLVAGFVASESMVSVHSY